MIRPPQDQDDPRPRNWQVAGNGVVLGALIVVCLFNVWQTLT